MRRPWTTAAAVLLVVLGACSGDDESGDGSTTSEAPEETIEQESVERPDDWPEVAPEVASATLAHLESEGVPAIEFVDAAGELVASEEVDCEASLEEFEAGVDAGTLLELIGGIPDPVLNEMILSQRTAVMEVLSACEAGSPPPEESLESIRILDEYVALRLDELQEAAG